MKSINLDKFNLKHTLESGQVFGFQPHNGGYLINSMNEFFFVKQAGSKLYYDNVKRNFLNSFFRLGDDYSGILKSINKDEIMNNAIGKFNGLRVMEQHPWQCLVSFICSSCSNIPRITQNLQSISEQFGNEVEYDGIKSFTFPSAGKIGDRRNLSRARLGYREDYLLKANKLVSEELLFKLRNGSLSECREYLMSLPGVGIKVADCVSLFSLRQDEAFPVDVWIRKALNNWYLGGSAKPKEIENFVGSYFDSYAGHAQQFIYHYSRIG